MSQAYVYSITGDFPNQRVNADSLTAEIEDSSISSAVLEYIDLHYENEECEIVFDGALSSGDETTLDGIVAAHQGNPPDYSDKEVFYWEQDPIITDDTTGITGPFSVIQSLVNRRELFNDSDSPLHVTGHQPILGTGGILDEQGQSISNMDEIHSKDGWHQQQVTKSLYSKPKDLLIYYGYLNSFNYGDNAWTNEKVAQDMARYDVLVFGDGIQNPSHPDYSNTQVIIPRIKALNPSALIFGYVSADQSIGDFQTKAGQWDALQVHGVFMDEAGYDFGRTRSEFNARVDYVHGQTYAKLAFANAWNTDNILGTANDPSYPNSTYNNPLTESALDENDWILLESLAVNTTAYSGNDGYESASQWSARVDKMIGLRAAYGVNFAGSSVIANASSDGDALSRFACISSMMASLGAFGTSDTSYASSSATVKRWEQPRVVDLKLWNLNSSIQVDAADSDVYWRFVQGARLMLDFSDSAQKAEVQYTPGVTVDAYGVESLSSETTKAVTFDVPFPEFCEVIILTPEGNVNCWVTGKSRTGFTINMSTSYTGDVYWIAKGS